MSSGSEETSTQDAQFSYQAQRDKWLAGDTTMAPPSERPRSQEEPFSYQAQRDKWLSSDSSPSSKQEQWLTDEVKPSKQSSNNKGTVFHQNLIVMYKLLLK